MGLRGRPGLRRHLGSTESSATRSLKPASTPPLEELGQQSLQHRWRFRQPYDVDLPAGKQRRQIGVVPGRRAVGHLVGQPTRPGQHHDGPSTAEVLDELRAAAVAPAGEERNGRLVAGDVGDDPREDERLVAPAGAGDAQDRRQLGIDGSRIVGRGRCLALLSPDLDERWRRGGRDRPVRGRLSRLWAGRRGWRVGGRRLGVCRGARLVGAREQRVGPDADDDLGRRRRRCQREAEHVQDARVGSAGHDGGILGGHRRHRRPERGQELSCEGGLELGRGARHREHRHPASDAKLLQRDRARRGGEAHFDGRCRACGHAG